MQTEAYAPYWEDDYAEPVLVRLVKRAGEFFDVTLPTGELRQVHMHHLGQFRRIA